jgi:predicted dehydrogenase
MKLGIGLYGENGHQIMELLDKNKDVELLAVANIKAESLTEEQRHKPELIHYNALTEMLEDKRVHLISLCSPRRRDQARDAVMCLNAGKHVYAEKPCAMDENKLDQILYAANRNGVQFHEMAGTAFDEPYLSMSDIVKTGTIGTVVQVFAQKSYPLHSGRPQDEDIDGGLIGQSGIHAIRMIEHVAGVKITSVSAIETKLGNFDSAGGLQIAAVFMMKLGNGGVASAVINYLNPSGFGSWSNEHLRIFGTKGFVEATDGGSRTRLIVNDQDLGVIKLKNGVKTYFDMIVGNILDKEPMPISIDSELHPVRVVIEAKKSALCDGEARILSI